MATYLRVASPIDLWDGTASPQERANALADEPDWSLYRIDSLSPAVVLAAFFGNRGGHQPLVGPGYVLLPEEILVAYGRLEKTTAGFTWPAWVAQEHYDLLEHQENAQQIIAALDGAGTTLLVVPRDELLAEMGRLALPPAAEALYRSQVIKRLRRVQEGEPELWNRVASRYSAPQLQAVEALLLPKKK